MSDKSPNAKSQDTITFVDNYQTSLNAGTYNVTATLTVPDALKVNNVIKDIISKKVKLHVAGPRFFLPPSEVHSVFPPENGEGDYNNVLPHIVLNRPTLPWERLVDGKSEDIPFLALLIFNEDEEANGDVTPPISITLEELGYPLEPGEKPTDKVNVIDVKQSLLDLIMPSEEELRLLAHGRESSNIGITPSDVLTSPDGMLIKSILSECSAAKSGLKNGDIIVKIGDLKVTKLEDITNALEKVSKVTVTIRRDLQDLEIELEKPQRAVVITNRLPTPPMPLGIIPDLTKTNTSSNLTVKRVQSRSFSKKVGITDGDIIKMITIKDKTVNNLRDLSDVLLSAKPIDYVKVNFQNGTNTIEKTEMLGEVNKIRNIAHLVMLEKPYKENSKGPIEFAAEKLDPIRLVCLKSWQFTCSEDEPTLKGRLLSKTFTFEPLCVPKTNNGDTFEPIRTMSYAALPYHLRWGDRTHTLYHGPIVAAAINDYPNKNAVDELSTADKKVAAAVEEREKAGTDALKSADEKVAAAIKEREKVIDKQIPASADGLVRLLQDQRIFDVSLAAAWQLGQLLMLRDQSVAMEYFSWRRRNAQIRARDWKEDGHLHHGDDIRIGLTDMPATVIDWCQKRLELHGLPFEYLIPDARMLPENSLRIFRIHETWMECLLGGALSVGRAGKEDRILEANYRAIAFPNQFRDRTGFLLRSPAVEEHRDLKVTASSADKPSLSQVRVERIAPGLLLGIYAGTFTKLEFSLPPIGLHFGLAEEDGGGFVKYIKDETTGKNKTNEEKLNPMKANCKDVVDISKLSKDIAKALNPNSNDKLTPGRFAFQMCEGTESVEFGINNLR